MIKEEFATCDAADWITNANACFNEDIDDAIDKGVKIQISNLLEDGLGVGDILYKIEQELKKLPDLTKLGMGLAKFFGRPRTGANDPGGLFIQWWDKWTNLEFI